MKRLLLKRVLPLLLLGVLILAGVVVARAMTLESKQLEPLRTPPLKVDADRLAQNLAKAIRIKTISHKDPNQFSREAFQSFRDLLAELYPKTHAELKREEVGLGSLLYTWAGSDPDAKPILLLAHIDVVPADAEAGWTHPPFAGVIADGFIWGRGALDDKSSLVGLLEAVEALLVEGFQPKRTIYLAFGHDEEVGGKNGAVVLAKRLESRGVKAEFCLDEGMAVVEDIVPGMTTPVALIGTAEKGYLSLELIVEGPGGHSSQPPKETVLGILSEACAKIDANRFPGRLQGPLRQMFETLVPEMSFGKRLVLANLWLFGPLVQRELEASKTTAAALRTTTAVTIMEGGWKDNVLPRRARAVVNFRLMPGDTADGVTARVQQIVDDDRVQIRSLDQVHEASPVCDVDAESYRLIHRTIRAVFPDAIVAPALDLAATDSRHYRNVAENTYRFGPLRLNEDDLDRIHGKDERIGVEDYARCVQFFGQLMRKAAS